MPPLEPFHILIIEDSPDDRSDIRRMLLRGSDRHFTFTEASSGQMALGLIDGMERLPDCILLDFHLPDMDALEMLGHLRRGEDLTLAPVVVLTGSAGGDMAVIPAGAQDYLGKGWASPEGLTRAVQNAVERYVLAKERLSAMQALQASEEFSRTVFQSSPDCVKIMDQDGVLLDLNEPGRCLLELDSPDELLGTRWHENWPEEHREQVRAAVRSALKGEVARFDGFCPTAKGNPKWWDVQVSAVRRPDGLIDRLVAVSRDVTSQKLASQMLQETSDRLALGLDVSGVSLAHIDYQKGDVHLSGNTAALFGLGKSAVTVSREVVHATFHPDDRAAVEERIAVAQDPHGERLFVMDHRVVWPDGQVRWLRVHKRVFFDGPPEAPVPVKGILAALDITVAKHAEMELAQAARRKDEFLAMLAHELRNPLAPLLTGVEVIARQPENTEAVREIGEMMKRQVNQMAHLIDDLLDVSRITNNKVELQLEPISLHAVLMQAVESVKPLVDTRDHTLTLEKPTEDVTLVADHHRLTQVVSNLLTNAAKYTPPGGKIHVTAAVDAAGAVDISVKDSGQGIDPENQARIFNLFDQGPAGEREGLGIGLTLVRSLMEMHGGTVSVASEGAGKGSEFRVRLPATVTGGSSSTGEADQETAEADAPLRVLIADDGRSTADVLGMFFRMEGMDCRVVYDGGKAVEEALAFRPQLACFDLGMPVLDGFQACREVRGQLPDCYLVALSGWGSESDRAKTAEAGFDEHIVKPVSPDDLRRLIGRATRK
ncbi:MAG: response regulator [Verrucomicrobiaceae bacterium]|nr:MAG: response regulator [Verrucomicrobiaceae bacterium]